MTAHHRVRPRRRPVVTALRLGLALLAILASPASAATAYIDGISDQNVPRWNGGTWDGGPAPSPFARFLGANLIAGSPAPLRYARYVVAYDVMCDPLGPASSDFRAWLADVEVLGLQPVVAFWYGNFHGNECRSLPAIPHTVAQFDDRSRGAGAFLRAFPQVRIIEPWNEPNDGRGPDVAPATAASFWLAAGPLACLAGLACDTVIAGDFNDAQPNLVAYERDYVHALSPIRPPDWGIHPYEAVNDRETATLAAFYAGLPGRYTARVWYTEVGAYYCTPTANPQDGASPAALQSAQEAAAHFLVDTLMRYPFTPAHVFYYEFMYRDNLPAACAVRDSALFGPAGPPGGDQFVARAAAQDILPLAVTPATVTGGGAPTGGWVYDPGVDWQIWDDPWRATSFRS